MKELILSVASAGLIFATYIVYSNKPNTVVSEKNDVNVTKIVKKLKMVKNNEINETNKTKVFKIQNKGDYDKGFKYFRHYFKNIKVTVFLKQLNLNYNNISIITNKENFKKLIENSNLKNKKEILKGVNIIFKKHKQYDLKEFLKGILEGKIPAGC